jgi:hypothetical protein
VAGVAALLELELLSGLGELLARGSLLLFLEGLAGLAVQQAVFGAGAVAGSRSRPR